MTVPGVQTTPQEPEPQADSEPRDEARPRKVKTRGRFLAFVGGFTLLAALLFPFYVVETLGRGVADFSFWSSLALGACLLGAIGAFTLTVNPGRFAPLFPVLLPLPALGLALAALLGFGTTRAYAVGAGLGAWLALAGAVITVLGGIRGAPSMLQK